MSSNWPIVTIDEIKAKDKNSIAIGPFGSRMKSDCYVDSGIPEIRGNNLGSGPEFVNDFVYVSEDKANELASCNVYSGDLVFPHRGSIGEVGIVEGDSRYVLSTSLMKLTCDAEMAVPQYVYYFFKSARGRHELLKNASQVGTPGIGQPLTSLKAVEIPLPPLTAQKRIASVLRTIDSKIQLNHQINQTLEQMAQAIFKSWFVDFEPVKAKIAALEAGGSEEDALLAAMQAISAKDEIELARLQAEQPEQYAELRATAELFPSAMQDSELGEIPEGWADGILSDIANFSSSRISKDELTLETYISTENMLANRKGVCTASSLPSSASVPSFESGEILISNIRPYFKKIWLANKSGGRSPDVLGFTCRHKGTNEYLFNLLYQDDFFEYMMLTSKGAKMPRGDKKAIMQFGSVIPPIGLMKYFSERVKPFYVLATSQTRESESLESLRDTLLPKLLSRSEERRVGKECRSRWQR